MRPYKLFAGMAYLLVSFAFMGIAQAAVTDLANAPMTTSSSLTVKPNVMLVLDDSGSMAWTHMPDNVKTFVSKYGYVSSQCNGVYYDPTVVYAPPVDYSGASYPNASFTGAWKDGFKTTLGIVDLSTAFYAYDDTTSYGMGTDAAQPAYYYTYSGTQTTEKQRDYYTTSSTFYQECNTGYAATIYISGSSTTSVTGITVNGVQILSGSTSSSNSSSTVASRIADNINQAGYSATSSGSRINIYAPPNVAVDNLAPLISKSGGMAFNTVAFSAQGSGMGLFTKVTVGSNSGVGGIDERQNFANWFSYYRTRILMMKTSSGLAFNPIDDKYRVGFLAINHNNGTNNDFLNIDVFDKSAGTTSQKAKWYNQLYSSKPSGGTALRASLSQAGLIYANKISQIYGINVVDPMQYSCQQNFTILSTDGFWNDDGGVQLDGTTSVGNQDSAEDRPMNDGGGAIVTTKTPTTTVVRTQTVTVKATTTSWSRNEVTVPASKNCSSNTKYNVVTQKQKYNQVVRAQTTLVVDQTNTSIRTVVINNGVVTSDTTASATSSSNVSNQTSTVSDTGAPDGSTAWADNGAPSTSCKTSPSPYLAGTTNVTNPSNGGSSTATESGPVTTTISTTGPTVGAVTTTSVSTGGTSDTLADAAEYYYITDLRNTSLSNCTGAIVSPATVGNNICENNVPSGGQDAASWQHMTTFTLGLGARGRMVFSPSYLSDTSGDFFAVKNGSIASATVCTWQTIGSACTWPIPTMNKPETIDDLWHTAVNGRGTYFSATNPATLAAGLSSALAGVTVRTGGTAAATTSSPNIVTGDNFVFSSNFTSGEWSGELFRFELDPVTLDFSAQNDWEAQALLDAKVSRNIYTYDPAAGNGLKSFTWDNLTSAEKSFFSAPKISSLTQFCTVGITCLSDASKLAAAGSNLVNFLRGDRTNEGVSTDPSKYYRQRAHLLGDIINSEAVYVKAPHYAYVDTGYDAYKTSHKSRQGMVYVAANDGMLHAFNADTGDESWSYIPSSVLPKLYKLADKDYANHHEYYVDGTPAQGDVYFGGAWHTVVIGGLNGGGRGYYALDVTDPASPKALWEFTYDTGSGSGYITDANLGYSFGKPVITKLKNGTWVAVLTSGYNNISPGDGNGHLYVLNIGTGAQIISGGIPTNAGGYPAGSATTVTTGCSVVPCPSGLAQINQWADNPTLDNTAKRVYGGDMFGNVWRFDIDDNLPPGGNEAQLLATLRGSAGGNVQPVMTKPVLGDVNGSAIVYVGTGRYLGTSDLGDTSSQSLYAIKDNLGTTSYGNPRSDASFIKQTLTIGTCPTGSPASRCKVGQSVLTGSRNSVDFGSDHGWYVDFPRTGERANTDPQLALGILGLNTNVPDATACTSGGFSYSYFFDYRTGVPIAGSDVVGISLGNGLASRPVYVEGSTGKVATINQVDGGGSGSSSGVGGTKKTIRPQLNDVPPPSGVTDTKRISWRELTDE